MKVKLLKKVRKRFIIEKVISVDNPENILYGYKLPLYTVSDTEDSIGFRFKWYKEYDDAYSYLCRMIKTTYYKKIKNRRNRSYSEIIWYRK